MTYISAKANMESHEDAVEIIFLKRFALPCNFCLASFAEEGQALTHLGCIMQYYYSCPSKGPLTAWTLEE